MSEGERSLTGGEKRAWVKVLALEVYEDFRKEKAEAASLQELSEACEDQATPRKGVDPSVANLLYSAEHQLPLLVSPAENSGMAIAMLDDQGLECASQSFGRMHEEESAIPISQLSPDSAMGMNNSNQLNLLQIVHNQQELITYLQQQLEESRIHISQLEYQHCFQQQLQVRNQGVLSFEVEM